MAGTGCLADVARPPLQMLPRTRARPTAARPKGLGAPHLGRRDQEDPDVPRDVAHYERAQRHTDRAEESPVRPCHRRGAYERRILGHDVRAAVERGRGQITSATLHEAAPKEL